MAAPTFVAEYEVAAWNVNTSPRLVSVTTAVGDRLIVLAVTEAGGTSLATPTGGSLTYSLAQSINPGASNCRAYIWTATATAATTFNVSITATGSDWWGYTVLRFSGSAGFGNSSGTSGTGAPSLALTTTGANSAVITVNGDWNADTGARTWRTINAITPTAGNNLERVYASTTNYIAYVAYWNDVGAAGSKTTGLTQPTGQKYSIASIEVLGGSADQNVSPTGIASAEAFGTAVVSNANTIAPTGIASGEAFGTATITTANTITPGGIASAEAFGTATVTTTNTITPAGIGSAEAFGTATISTANTIAPTGIASAEAFGTATVSAANDIAPTGIGSAEAFGTAAISTSNEILPAGIGSAEAFGNAVVALQGTQIIAPPSIGSAEAFGTAAISTAATIAPTGIASAEAFGTATVGSEATISPGGIGSAEAFGLPTVSAGEVVIAPVGIPSAEAFGTPTVTDSSLGQIIAPIGIPSGERFGQPYVWIHLVRACDCSVLVDD